MTTTIDDPRLRDSAPPAGLSDVERDVWRYNDMAHPEDYRVRLCLLTLARARKLLELPLLFHSGSDWRDDKRELWRGITGSDDATTRAMCDAIRAFKAGDV